MNNQNSIVDALKELKKITNSINSIQNQITQPLEAKKSNTKNSILIKIPKYLILSRIAPFLTNRECNYLSSTCITMRRCIYSPLGWKILTYSHSPFPIAISNTEFSQSAKMKKNQSMTSSELEQNIEDYEDQEYLLRERGKFKEVLWTRYKQQLSAQQKNQVLSEKVRSEKIFLFKRGLKKDYYHQIVEDLEKQSITYKQSLKKITQQFSHRYEKLQSQTLEIEQENHKLQKQKQALVGKIKQYQKSMPTVSREAQKSKQILKILKDFVIDTNFEELQSADFDI